MKRGWNMNPQGMAIPLFSTHAPKSITPTPTFSLALSRASLMRSPMPAIVAWFWLVVGGGLVCCVVWCGVMKEGGAVGVTFALSGFFWFASGWAPSEVASQNKQDASRPSRRSTMRGRCGGIRWKRRREVVRGGLRAFSQKRAQKNRIDTGRPKGGEQKRDNLFWDRNVPAAVWEVPTGNVRGSSTVLEAAHRLLRQCMGRSATDGPATGDFLTAVWVRR